MTGPLEFEINADFKGYPNDRSIVAEFYNDPENPWTPQVVTREDIEDLTKPETEQGEQWRMFAFSKHGNSYICFKGCASSSTPFELVCHDASISAPSNGSDVFGEEFFFGVEDDTISLTLNDYTNGGLGDDSPTGAAESFDVYEDHGGNDTIVGGTYDDLIISRGGGEIITGNGDNGDETVQTIRIYPTHETDHLFGWRDPSDLRQCTKMLDVRETTNFELVLDDQWYPDYKYTNEDDYCSLLVHGWELAWYWGDDDDGGYWDVEDVNKVDIWFSRDTGMADFCLTSSDSECVGEPYESAPFCITYWVKCDKKSFAEPSTVEQDLVSQAWGSWFGW